MENSRGKNRETIFDIGGKLFLRIGDHFSLKIFLQLVFSELHNYFEMKWMENSRGKNRETIFNIGKLFLRIVLEMIFH